MLRTSEICKLVASVHLSCIGLVANGNDGEGEDEVRLLPNKVLRFGLKQGLNSKRLFLLSVVLSNFLIKINFNFSISL